MAGKIFDSGTIQPKGFIEYVPTNLTSGIILSTQLLIQR
jgi:hypothetical protein